MSEKNINIKYTSFTIPDRKEVIQDRSKPSSQTKPKKPDLHDDGLFYELEYGMNPNTNSNERTIKPQYIEAPAKDEIRELFTKMRDIAHVNRINYDYFKFYDRRIIKEK